MRPPRGDRGVAAVELALVIGLFLPLISLAGPLAFLFYEDLQLGRTAGDVVRFASSRTDGDRIVPGAPDVPGGGLPTQAQITAEAQRAYTGAGTVTVQVGRTTSSTTGCPSGIRRSVQLTSTVDLGPFAGFVVGSTRTLTARATSCEE